MPSRPRHTMPGFIKTALTKAGLMERYQARPPYQRNDYLGWITRAKRDETQRKRLTQMLDELERGNVYMNMQWKPKKLPNKNK